MTNYTPTIPDVDYAQRLVTFQDAVEVVLDRYGRNATGRDLRLARRAVLDAYDEFPTRHEWSWLSRWMQIAISPIYDTGTVGYDHTGGTYERKLTLASGTWPTDAAFGWVVIDNTKWYAVEDRKSTTVVTLREDSNPGADITAGETYWWMRQAYPLPPDFWQASTPLDTERGTNSAAIREVTEAELMVLNLSRGKFTNAATYWYAFGSDPRIGGGCILLGPPLTAARTLTIPYQSRGRPLGVYAEIGGTIATTSSSAVVTGTDTDFTSALVGSVFRISSTTKLPTSRAGSLEGDYNPATITRIVKSVESTTSLTLDATAGQTLSGKAYVASDPLDIDPLVCGNAFTSLADYMFMCFERGLMTEERAALLNNVLRRFETRELMLAKDADRKSSVVPPSPVWSGASWAWPFGSLTLLPPG